MKVATASVILSMIVLSALSTDSFCQSLQDRLDDLEHELIEMEHARTMRQLEDAYRRQQPPKQAKQSQSHYIGRDSKGIEYSVHTDTIKKINNGNITFTFSEDGNFPRYIKNFTYFGSFVAVEINCNSSKIKYLSKALFSKNNTLVGQVDYSPEFSQITSNSMLSDMQRYVCR